MVHITVSLEKETEQTLRNLAQSKYKNKKGAMAKVITESLQIMAKESKRKTAMERQFKWMDEGFAMGKILAKKREDLYDRI